MATYIRLAVLAAAGFLAVTPAITQEQTRTRTTEDWKNNETIKSSMKDLESKADAFENKLASALDRSGYDGTHIETLMKTWADGFEDQVDDMVEDFNENDTEEFIQHFENAMMIGASINRAMLRQDFATAIQTEWNDLRGTMNHIAKQLHRPVLPNITVAVINLAPPTTMAKPDVKTQVEFFENHVDLFEDKFDAAVNMSTANLKPREELFKGWAEQFEDAADDMLENFKENDPKDFQYDLERALLVGEMINRMMTRSAMGEGTEAAWKVVRDDLNKLAGFYGYPILTDPVTAN